MAHSGEDVETPALFELSYIPTRWDYLHASMFLWRRRRWALMAVVALVMSLLPAALMGLMGGDVRMGLVGGVLATPLVLVLLLGRVWLGAWLRIRGNSEAYPVGPQSLRVTARELELSGPDSHAQLRWSSLRGVERSRHAVVLRLSDLHGLMVPRRAFASDGAVEAFIELVEQQRTEASESANAAEVPAGFDLFQATWVPEAGEWIALSRHVARVQFRRRRWLRALSTVVLGTLLAVLTALALVDVWLGNSPRSLLGPALLWLGALVLGTLPLWWMALVVPVSVRRGMAKRGGRYPEGELTLAVGASGIWSRSSRGVSQLPWSQVSRVQRDRSHTFFMVGERLGIVLPDRIAGTRERADHLRQQAESFIAAERG